MKSFPHIAVALLAVFGAVAHAACPPAAAAKVGAQEGYQRDRAAAIDNEKRESASSDALGKCVGGISSVIVVPAFPSLSDIFARAADKACHVASDKLREAATLPRFTVPGMPTTTVPVQILPPPVQRAAAPAPSSFWERIWR